MTTATTLQQVESPNGTVSVLPQAHASIVSIVVMLVVIIVLVERAGSNGSMAKWSLAIIGSAVFLRLMSNNGQLAGSLSKYPWIP